jgi:hypothetical protein
VRIAVLSGGVFSKAIFYVPFPTRQILLALLTLLAVSGVRAQERVGAVSFRFAFGALTGSGQNQRLSSITQDRTLASGDRVKLMVELQQPESVYLIHRGSHGDLTLLFPTEVHLDARISPMSAR